ncbi:nucleotidyltransferase family protein [bacterium]|nr:nucleotidyltransferase family protein [bacterium]
MKNELQKIMSKLNEELPEIKFRYNVSSMEVFGSFIHGEQKARSDLDILVTFKKTPSLFEFIELEEYLSDLLGLKVDLVMKSSLKPNIGRKILSEALPVS